MQKQLPDLVRVSSEEKAFLANVCQVMERYFANDISRITHAHDVTNYVIELLQYVDADAVIAISAGLLHDIGIPEAERKYGRCDGKSQELEGPPVARMLLADVGADDALIGTVCELVGSHHTPAATDSPEFRILWDADALVNLAEVVGDKEPYAIESILNKAMVTEAGYRLACKKYLPVVKSS